MRLSIPVYGWGLYALVIGFLVSIFAQYPYLFNDFLVGDDTRFVSRAFLGDPSIPPTHPAIYWFLEVLLPAISVPALKLLSMLMFGVLAALCCCWLSIMGTPKIVATVLGLFIALFPISLEQGLFVTGSHALYGSSFIVASAYSTRLAFSPQRSVALAITLMLVADVLAIAGRLTSPSLFLGTSAPLIIAVGCWIGLKMPLRKASVLIAFAAIPIAFSILHGIGYHYQSRTGWVSFSTQTVLSNLESAVSLVLRPTDGPIGYLYFVFVVALVLGVVVGRRHVTKESAVLGGALMILAALAFGPSAVVTEYLARYAFAPFVLAMLAIGTVVGPLCSHLSPKQLGVLTSLTVAMIAVSVLVAVDARDELFADRLSAYIRVKEIVIANEPNWPEGSQVVVALHAPFSSPAEGYNHWSTWYIRYLARRPDLIGLIGNARQLDSTPFVVQWREHGPEYRSEKNGRWGRVKMRGLLTDRPLFAYNLQGGISPNQLCPSDVVIEGSRVLVLAPGQIPTNQTPQEMRIACRGEPIQWTIETWTPM